jgi:aspartyl-tRNA(Asn)/glutamyl-tRNA(Gln) amidotransferase subunit C
MPDARDEFDPARIASLARLALTSEEAGTFRTQLAAILAFAARVRDVDTTGVPAMTRVWQPALPERPDEVRPSLAPAEALANAPDRTEDPALVRVPRVIG